MKIAQIDAFEILSRITDGFFALDEHWRFTYMNEKASILLFRNRDDLYGKNVWEEFPEAVQLPFYDAYHQAVREQVPVSFDAYFPPLCTWFDVRAYPSQNGLTVFFTDITIKKRALSANEQHYRSLFDQNPDAVFSFDLHGNYLSVNPAMQHMLGYTEEELLQLSFTPLVVESDVDRIMGHYQKAAHGCTQHYEAKALHKDGSIVHVEVTNIPIVVDGEIVGVYGMAKDISKQKQTEEQLVRSEKLSAVGQLSASIAHEIRNPLTSLKGFLQLMRTSLQEELPHYFNIMADEITRIEMITSELLLLAKPQPQQFHFRQLEEIVQNVTMLLSSQALINNVDIHIDCEELPPVNCIGDQLKQVFINLIKNSIEAMPQGGNIYISLRRQPPSSISITIRDEGCGIPEELLSKIGLPFYTTKEKGTGLGMLTTYKIIESHNGSLSITSKVGAGTTIIMQLPMNPLHPSTA